MAKYQLYIKRDSNGWQASNGKIVDIKVGTVGKVNMDIFENYVKNETDVFPFNGNYWYSHSKKALIKFGNDIIKKDIDKLWELKL